MTEENALLNHNLSPSTPVGGCPPEVPNTEPQPEWFVLRATYSREHKAEALLRAEQVDTFVPPTIHNLLFAYSTREFLDAFKRRNEETCPLRYMIDHARRRPMVVPTKDMEDFIRVTREMTDLLYLDTPSVVLEKGQPVEIIRGPYKGVRGYVLRILRDRRIVLTLEGLVSVALNGIAISDVQPINE